MKLFAKIHELVEDQETLVCVLIDEVESLTSARKSAMSGSEPSDAIRVVNAVLTQYVPVQLYHHCCRLDQLKNFKNVLVLTTSNITKAIGTKRIYNLISCLQTLHLLIVPMSRYTLAHRVNAHDLIFCTLACWNWCVSKLLHHKKRYQTALLTNKFQICSWTDKEASQNKYSLKLKQVAEQCDGLSGRALRKMPFIAHAFFIKAKQTSLSQFLHALELAVKKESLVRKKLDE